MRVEQTGPPFLETLDQRIPAHRDNPRSTLDRVDITLFKKEKYVLNVGVEFTGRIDHAEQFHYIGAYGAKGSFALSAESARRGLVNWPPSTGHVDRSGNISW